MKKLLIAAVLATSTLTAGSAFAAPLPSGWTSVGNAGSSGADGVVTLSPSGNSQYQWVSTAGGVEQGGVLTGFEANSRTGSSLTTSAFSVEAGDILDFYFNYVTSDGAGFADYGWAQLVDTVTNISLTLFTARTQPSGDIVPGFGLPATAPGVTLGSAQIIGGGPAWSPLAASSGACFSGGCGHTGWVLSSYTLPTAGTYQLRVGVSNWDDAEFDSGLALDGVQVNDVDITNPGQVPEPATFGLLGLSLLGLGLSRRRKAA
jgi:PEP-CTERM motif